MKESDRINIDVIDILHYTNFGLLILCWGTLLTFTKILAFESLVNKKLSHIKMLQCSNFHFGSNDRREKLSIDQD